MTSASQHSKGWSGIAFCLVLAATIGLIGVPPAANAPASAITAYLHAQQGHLLLASWLALPIGAFFLWFAIGLAAWLRSASPNDEGLPAYVRFAAVVTVAIGYAQNAVLAALAMRPPADPSFGWVLNTLLFGAVGSMPMVIFLFGTAHSMRRHASAPAWLMWLGYLSAAGQVLVTLGMFYQSGIAADNLPLYAIAGLLPLVFIVATSLCMVGVIRARRAAGSV